MSTAPTELVANKAPESAEALNRRASVANPVSAFEKTNLLGFSPSGMEQLFAEMGEKPFRARQLLKWIYHRKVTGFADMTDLSKKVRSRLEGEYEIRLPEVVVDKTASDGTRKWVLKMEGGNAIETIAIPDGNRVTLCVSSQVGCVLDCTFCSTATQGFNRNLSMAEIVGQLWVANEMLGPKAKAEGVACSNTPTSVNAITNVVMMGMGEPLANYQQVLPAMQLFTSDFGFGLSRKRVTVSTSGLVPYIDKLGVDCDVALAISLHAPTDELREQIVPINRRYPIAELMAACDRYVDGKSFQMSITYEYVMLDGVNDQPEQARQLVKLLAERPAKLNLIPFNPFPDTQYQRSSDDAIAKFQKILMNAGVVTTVRRTRGDDIDAACGQLVGQVKDRSRRRERWEKLGRIPVRTESADSKPGDSK